MPLQFIGAFESTYLPRHDRDVLETTGHVERVEEDLDLVRRSGVTRLRYPIRWHRIEADDGSYDWRETDAVLAAMAACGLTPIVDLVHHTSYPAWLSDGFSDPRFPDAYVRYCEAFARRYPQTREYTLFNEPFSTLFLASHEGLWPPYQKGLDSFVRMLRNVLPAIAEASRVYRRLLPEARHVYTDTCEHHTAEPTPAGRAFTAMANDRRFFVLDALLGRIDDRTRPFVAQVIEAGGEDLLRLEPMHLDVLGLDYYAHCQWHFDGTSGYVPTRAPVPLAAQIMEYWERYRVPCMLAETNIRGFASDRASWLKFTLEQCEQAQAAGVEMDGYCWFPFIDSCDWDSLLYHCDGNVDPVGVYWLDESLGRRASSMSATYALAAAGAPAAALPAYHFRPPVSQWLTGFLPLMAHWEWQAPPSQERCSNKAAEDEKLELRIRNA